MKRPHHLMLADTGDLYDCRVKGWSALPPLRHGYAHHHAGIANAQQLKACLRAGASTDLGGYPLFFVCSDGDIVSFAAVLADLPAYLNAYRRKGPPDPGRIVRCLANMDDQELECSITGERIPAAYGTED